MIQSRAQREGIQRQRDREASERKSAAPEKKEVEPLQMKSFECPITTETFVNPLVAADGYTYEAEAFAQWTRTENRSPMTNLPLPSLATQENHALKQAIAEFQEQVQPRLQSLEQGEREAKALKKQNVQLKKRLKQKDQSEKDRIKMFGDQLEVAATDLCDADRALQIKSSIIVVQGEQIERLREENESRDSYQRKYRARLKKQLKLLNKENANLRKELEEVKSPRSSRSQLSQQPAFFAGSSPRSAPLEKAISGPQRKLKSSSVENFRPGTILTVQPVKPRVPLRMEDPVSPPPNAAVSPVELRPGMMFSPVKKRTINLYLSPKKQRPETVSTEKTPSNPIRRSLSMSSLKNGIS